MRVLELLLGELSAATAVCLPLRLLRGVESVADPEAFRSLGKHV
jgi:hypothetical protein